MLRTRGTGRVYRRDSLSHGQIAGRNAADSSTTGTQSKFEIISAINVVHVSPDMATSGRDVRRWQIKEFRLNYTIRGPHAVVENPCLVAHFPLHPQLVPIYQICFFSRFTFLLQRLDHRIRARFQ